MFFVRDAAIRSLPGRRSGPLRSPPGAASVQLQFFALSLFCLANWMAALFSVPPQWRAFVGSIVIKPVAFL